MAIAFAGEYGAYAELAAREFFGLRHKPVPVPVFEDVFSAVSAGTIQYGIVPIENSLVGSIHQNYDNLMEHRLQIFGEITLQIDHYLIAIPGVKLSAIKQVYSIPAALGQCRHFLKKMPGVEQVPASNTAASVKFIRDQNLRDAAAIASMQAVIDYKMSIVAHSIQDSPDTRTRFIILSRDANRLAGKSSASKTAMKSSIVFSLKNVPGVLYKCLSVFALRDIDLYKIESRPAAGTTFEYLFYLDIAGAAAEKPLARALDHLSEITTFQRVLGSYPVGRIAQPTYRKRSGIVR